VTKQYTVRLASEQDAAKLAEWLIKTPNNLFDPDVAKYPNLRTLAVEMDGEPLFYFPFHVVLQGESLALNPDADKKHVAYGLRTLEKALLAISEQYGIREMFAACADDGFSTFMERHGWTPVQHKYLRRKVAPCVKPGLKQ
jgi:hypothetical protein